jgi:hypothetical protein
MYNSQHGILQVPNQDFCIKNHQGRVCNSSCHLCYSSLTVLASMNCGHYSTLSSVYMFQQDIFRGYRDLSIHNHLGTYSNYLCHSCCNSLLEPYSIEHDHYNR